MGRAVPLLAAIALLRAIAPSVASAQAARPLVRSPRPIVSPPFVSASLSASRSARGAQDESAGPGRVFTTSVSVIGGAALGSFLGYFLSQVVKSDWEGERIGDRANHRRRFTISGAAVGAIGGYLIRPRGRRARPEPASFYVYVAPTTRHYITNLELRRAIAVNALEAVQALRPEWLASTQFGSQSPVNAGSAAADDGSIVVYVVDTRIGGPDALAEVSIPEILELRLYEPREAARRWGTAHPHGAIEIVPSAAAGTR